MNIVCIICGKEFDTVRNIQIYCSKECKLKNDQKLRAEIYRKNHVVRYTTCPLCNKEFAITNHNVKYCSDACKEINKINQKINKPEFYEKTCKICGNIFSTKNNSMLTCSDECHKKSRIQTQLKYQRNKQEFNRRVKDKAEEKRKLQLELLKNEKKENFLNMISVNLKDDFYKYYIEDFEFCIFMENGYWDINVWQMGCQKLYRSKLHSNLYFDNKKSALDYCFRIYIGDVDYIKDYDKYVCNNKKIEDLKSKLKLPRYTQSIILSLIKSSDYYMLKEMLKDTIKKKIKVEVGFEEFEIRKLLYNKGDNLINIIEEYVLNKALEIVG